MALRCTPIFFTLGLLLVDATSAAAPKSRSAELVERAQQIAVSDNHASEKLETLAALIFDFTLHENPVFATYIGSDVGIDRWKDDSKAAIETRERHTRTLFDAVASIDADSLTDEERLNHQLLTDRLESSVEGAQYPGEYFVMNQRSGVQLSPVQILNLMGQSARGADDYEHMLGRLRALPELIKQHRELLGEGLEKGLTPPRITLRDIPEQFRKLLTEDPLDSPLAQGFANMRGVDEQTAADIRGKLANILTEEVFPAYRSHLRFVEESYIPNARTSIGISEIPDGRAWYRYSVANQTTTELTPQQIHEIGLAEVKRIRGEMEAIIEQTEFDGSFTDFTEFLRTDSQFFFETADDLLGAYREISKRADPELAKLFGKLPRTPYGVKEIPAYAAKSQTTAYYQPGTLEAGRAGFFYANTYDLPSRPKWEMEALTLHEAVPGHHLQISLASEMTDVPWYRQWARYTAFVEGWALYAESLGEEMGFYQDPYSKFGQLTYEMWRAIRLVVDTGMHEFGWSRDRAIEFFRSNTGKTDQDITVEIDRYIVWPGQALAYKIGELKIKELRAFAEAELGDDFDIRAFHDHLLAAGAIPLDLLDTRMRTWVARQTQTQSQTSTLQGVH